MAETDEAGTLSGGGAHVPASLANLLRGGREADWISHRRDEELVRLHEVQRLTYGELAERFTVSRNAISGMIRRARRRLEAGT